jgi:hypothetical protein
VGRASSSNEEYTRLRLVMLDREREVGRRMRCHDIIGDTSARRFPT